jgi:aminopeptidase-like protein
MDIEIREFTPINGSDERQYCSPGFNLPVGQMARTVYAQYEGYHNSLDTKEFMGINTLVDSVDKIEKLLRAVEYSGYFVNLRPFGEPQLGKRDLYPNRNDYEVMVRSSDTVIDDRAVLDRILTVLNYADGACPMTLIAEKCGCSVFDLKPIIDRLEWEGLLALRGSGR